MEILLSRAMAGAVSRWPLTEDVRVRARVSPCGIFGGRNSDGTSFSQSSSAFPANIIPPCLSTPIYHLGDEQ
jgi:hypothetical protein